MICRPLGHELLHGAITAMSVHNQDSTKAAVRHPIEDIAHDAQMGFHAQRNGTGELAEIGRYAIRQHGEHGNTERLGGIHGDALRQDAIDGEPQIAVLFGAAQWQHGTVVVPQVLLHLHPVHVADSHVGFGEGVEGKLTPRSGPMPLILPAVS